jgi:hypothetical protein
MLNRQLAHARCHKTPPKVSPAAMAQRQAQQSFAFSDRYYRKLLEMQNPVEGSFGTALAPGGQSINLILGM